MSQHKTADPQVLVPTSIERVRYHDGQLVDADALTAAMLFPASLLQLVLRSYFGCGIVCGLEVDQPDRKRPCIRISPGVMVDCHGYPLELCREVVLDLTPDPCDCEAETRTRCVVARHVTSDDVSRRPCGGGSGCSCGSCSGGDRPDCDRVRDQVLISLVDIDRLDPIRDHVCSNPPEGRDERGCAEKRSAAEKPSSVADGRGYGHDHDQCECLMACGERCCADRSWVLLACVTITPDADPCSVGVTIELDHGRRRYVKPIECCRSSQRRQSEEPEVRDDQRVIG